MQKLIQTLDNAMKIFLPQYVNIISYMVRYTGLPLLDRSLHEKKIIV